MKKERNQKVLEKIEWTIPVVFLLSLLCMLVTLFADYNMSAEVAAKNIGSPYVWNYGAILGMLYVMWAVFYVGRNA